MTEYIKLRAKQKSTWLGISAMIAAFATSGGVFSPEVIIAGLTALGLIDVNA